MSERTTHESVEDAELRRRVVYSLLIPVARLSARFGIPIKLIVKFAQLSYFRELRSAGASFNEIGTRMDVSTRTVKRLAQQLREAFFLPEVEHGLARQIEFILWGQPMSRARLLQLLDEDELDVDRALEQLVHEERVRMEEGRPTTYHTVQSVTRLALRENMVARIGALNSLMENVTNTVYGRFFAGDERTFARTISLRVREEDVSELRAFYESELLPMLTKLEERAKGDEAATELQLSMIWSPFDSLRIKGEDDAS